MMAAGLALAAAVVAVLAFAVTRGSPGSPPRHRSTAAISRRGAEVDY